VRGRVCTLGVCGFKHVGPRRSCPPTPCIHSPPSACLQLQPLAHHPSTKPTCSCSPLPTTHQPTSPPAHLQLQPLAQVLFDLGQLRLLQRGALQQQLPRVGRRNLRHVEARVEALADAVQHGEGAHHDCGRGRGQGVRGGVRISEWDRVG